MAADGLRLAAWRSFGKIELARPSEGLAAKNTLPRNSDIESIEPETKIDPGWSIG
jgi:hypothetical protein